MREDNFKLLWGRLRLEIKRNLLTERIVKDYNGLPREVVDSSEMFKKPLDVAFSVSWFS